MNKVIGKNRLLLVFLTLGTFALSAQTVTLTFTGRGSDNRYVRLNRVVIDNLSRNWQEVIYWPDTTLSMTNGTDVHDYDREEGFHLSQNTPNPFTGVTDVYLSLDEDGETVLTVYDMNGKQVVQYSGFLPKGGHNFRINLSAAQTYLLKASSGKRTASIKMVNNGTAGNNEITYIGEGSPIVVTLKSTTDKPFAYGDIMQYVGYGTVDGTELESSHIVQVQNSSQMFTLQFAVQEPQLPIVTTHAVTNVTDSSAISGGAVTSDGGSAVTERGVCWSTLQNPTLTDSHTSDGSGIGTFTSDITNLSPNTIYYVRAYATNVAGTAYGDQMMFLSDGVFTCGFSTVTDYDGNAYNTVQIGQQCWMKENLRTTHYADGTSISMGSGGTSSFTIPHYYDDINSSLALPQRGYYYNWPAVMHGASSSSTNPSGVQGICPTGWHVPSDAEWTLLTDYVSSQSLYKCNNSNTYIAKALASTFGWETGSNPCAVGNSPSSNNATGFSVVPASTLGGGGYNAYIWSSTEDDFYQALYCCLHCNSAEVNKESQLQSFCCPARCVKDETELPSVTTNIVTNITPSTAIGGGTVTFSGSSTVSARGICWSTSENPTVSDSHTTDGSGMGSFTSNLTGLIAGTTYYVRAYATNSEGTAYGIQMTFTAGCGTFTATDYDGNTYNTVAIGQQCWMRENLRCTHYADGTPIPAGGSNTSETSPYYYDYSSSSIALTNRGYLYNWPAVMHGEASSSANPSWVQGICPSGWHVPSASEWEQLENYVCGQSQYVCGDEYIAKALASTTGWNSSTGFCNVGNNQSSNNATGFSATPAGYYGASTFYPFQGAGDNVYFWSSTGVSNTAATRSLSSNSAILYNGNGIVDDGYSVRCIKDASENASSLPTVTTNNITNITFTTAICGGDVTASGGASVTARGVCWDTSQNPTVDNNHTSDGSGMGSYTSNITGLTVGTTYYVRAYATNSAGTAYGDQMSFTTNVVAQDGLPCPGASSVTDYDGNTYNTVQIGQQCWMKENLRTTHYADGTPVPAGGNNISITAPCYYNNSSSNIALMHRGLLYNWSAAMRQGASSSSTNPSGVQGICPMGWHLPSDSEWTQLTDYVSSMSVYLCSDLNFSYNIAKALASTSDWNASTSSCAVGNAQNLNNATGFSAVPAGYCYGTSFNGQGNYADFWSSTEDSDVATWHHGLYYDNAYVSNNVERKYFGFSVRCVKDVGGSTSSVPSVTTNNISNITSTSATCGGSVISDGGATVTAYGVCWSTSPSPTVNNSHTTNGAGTGSFTSNMTGLTAGTTYYVRAYATNSAGTAYGGQVSFTAGCGSITVSDYDGNTYNTVQIGQQCWMKENLKTTHLNDGTLIPLVQDTTTWSQYSTPAYCYYDKNVYGCLYNYYAVQSGDLCPAGWHVPSYTDVHFILNYALGGTSAGGQMKTTGTLYWASPNTGATNSSGFSARGGGYRLSGFATQGITFQGVFWTSTPYENYDYAYNYMLSYDASSLYRFGYANYDYAMFMGNGLSVRCVKD